MQFHHHGYVTGDPRVQPASGTGIGRPADLPDQVDVLIVGSGPAGMVLAAQLSQYPAVSTRLIERRAGRLEIGQADGIQARSVETFQAFGFAERLIAEAYHLTAMNFWGPDPADPSRIVRIRRTEDDPDGISEFPHLIINQARVLDYFAEAAAIGPARITPDYGWEFAGLEIADALTGAGAGEHGGEYPVRVTVRRTDGGGSPGPERTIRARYVVGCDGAHSAVRSALGLRLTGTQAMHAWAVLDALAVTDFPDIRTKCAISSPNGSILHIPREGGHLFRMYIDLGELTAADREAIRATTVDAAIAKANEIIAPYRLDVRSVPRYTVYEVAHRLTERFDDVPAGDTRAPRVFIAGDACHTHSAKAGQGMNVSMQDAFNLGWKLGQVVGGRSPEILLNTYSAERQDVARRLIDFDREWSDLMAKKPGELSPGELADFYVKTAEFPAGFLTEYPPSMIVGDGTHQALATGFPAGKRFKSAPVVRVCDANPLHLGHQARADGRWRVYAFADAATVAEASELATWAAWMRTAPDSPVVRFTPPGADQGSLFEVNVIFPGPPERVDISQADPLFLPRTGPFGLTDYERIYARDPDRDLFDERGIDRGGCVVVVRPDQYVACVLPFTARAELTDFFARSLIDARPAAAEPQVAGSGSG
jgi:phenol 2-monooxygenase